MKTSKQSIDLLIVLMNTDNSQTKPLLRRYIKFIKFVDVTYWFPDKFVLFLYITWEGYQNKYTYSGYIEF